MGRSVWAIVAAAFLAPACGDAAAVGSVNAILFVGNSLSFQVAATVKSIAAMDHYEMETGEEVEGNTAIIDHFLSGAAAKAISSHHWDMVVLQQGPTTHSLCYDTLVLSVQDLNAPIRAAGAVPALFMPWPAAGDSAGGAFDIVRESFQNAAKAVDGVFLPIGEAWRAAWKLDPSLQLYDSDGYHPTAIGTYLSALVVYEKATGHDARTLPGRAFLGADELMLPDAVIRNLQAAAHSAIDQFGAGNVAGKPPKPIQGPITC